MSDYLPMSIARSIYDYLGHECEVQFKVVFGKVVGQTVSKYAHVTGEGGGTSIGYSFGRSVVMAQRPIKIRSQEVEDRRLHVQFDESGREVVWRFSQNDFPAREGNRVAIVIGYFSESDKAYELGFFNLDIGHGYSAKASMMFEDERYVPGIDKRDRRHNANQLKRVSNLQFQVISQSLGQGALSIAGEDRPSAVLLLSLDQALKEKSKAWLGILVGVVFGIGVGTVLFTDRMTQYGLSFQEILSWLSKNEQMRLSMLGIPSAIFISCMLLPIFSHAWRQRRRISYAQKNGVYLVRQEKANV
jgi:hypothetical protein